MDNIISSISTDKVGAKNETDKRCAPHLTFDGGSCIKINLLVEMAKAYNADMQGGNKTGGDKMMIKLYDELEMLNPKKYKKYLLKQFSDKLQDKCGVDQRCWTEQSFIKNMQKIAKEELDKYTFRPTGPQGRFEWLNTLHINDVMNQYEKKYNDFKFLGAVPMDFDKLEYLGIKDLDYKNLVKNGKTKLGFVFNLDNHNQSGSHWVALYADIKQGSVLFFDSYKMVPTPEIRKLMRRIALFCKNEMGIQKLKIDRNKIRHQYENSECGVYSINFITRLLRGDSFEKICEDRTPDKKVNKCRNTYFNNTNV